MSVTSLLSMLASDIVGLLLLREEITALGQQTIATKKVIGMIDKVNGAMTRSHFRKDLVRARAAMASAPAPVRVRPKRTPATAPVVTEDVLDLEDSGSDDSEVESILPLTEEEEAYEYEEEAPPPPPKKKKVKKTKSSE